MIHLFIVEEEGEEEGRGGRRRSDFSSYPDAGAIASLFKMLYWAKERMRLKEKGEEWPRNQSIIEEDEEEDDEGGWCSLVSSPLYSSVRKGRLCRKKKRTAAAAGAGAGACCER